MKICRPINLFESIKEPNSKTLKVVGNMLHVVTWAAKMTI